MKYKEMQDTVLSEISEVLESIEEKRLDAFVNFIVNVYKNNGKVLGYSAGRMGFGLKAFLMRLNHLGINAYWFGDNYIPPMDENDLFVCCSNSGNTSSVFNIVNIFRNKADGSIVSFVGDEDSRIANMSDLYIPFKTCNGGLNSADDPHKIDSVQPMTTLTEQTMFIMFDIIIMMIIDKLQINVKDTKKYHSNIE